MNDFETNEEILIQDNICKSIVGQEDENGNYMFEVEASNENLDLQNQITLQSALQDSKEYFLTNGVISDDHLHKTRNPDGSVETHKEKIIGEPVSVRKEGKSTFVKGILYKGVEAAKPYIELLKNHSSRVKASIGGIMPKIRKNADGTETVTSFMWNDLALTCSPVNWTVGSARFAKSVGIVDFCKSLNAGSGTDSASYESGRALQKEDLEEETQKILDITDGDIKGDSKKDDIEKSDEELEVIKSCIRAIDVGDLLTKSDIESYLIEKGFNFDKASEITLEIIKQGGIKMKKSNFSSTIDELLKSFGKEEDEKKVQKKDSEDEETENTLFDDEETKDDSESDDVEKCGVKKSFEDEPESDYLDATELMKSMSSTIDSQAEEIASLKKSLEEVQENMIEVTKSFGDYLKQPVDRKTVVEKSMDSVAEVTGPNKVPTAADFDVLKSALVNATKNGKLGLEQVQFYNAEFQKSMKGQKIAPETWQKICSIVRENR